MDGPARPRHRLIRGPPLLDFLIEEVLATLPTKRSRSGMNQFDSDDDSPPKKFRSLSSNNPSIQSKLELSRNKPDTDEEDDCIVSGSWKLPQGFTTERRKKGGENSRMRLYYVSPEGMKFGNKAAVMRHIESQVRIPSAIEKRPQRKESREVKEAIREKEPKDRVLREREGLVSKQKRETVIEQTLEEEESFAGSHWLNRRVETYWGNPVELRGFYPGTITDWRRVNNNDIEYLVKYDQPSSQAPVTEEEWESVDDGFRFQMDGYQHELRRAKILRKIRGTFTAVDIKKKEATKHTRIGTDYQVDTIPQIGEEARSNARDEELCGELRWDPEKFPLHEVTAFLDEFNVYESPGPYNKVLARGENFLTTDTENALFLLKSFETIEEAVVFMKVNTFFINDIHKDAQAKPVPSSDKKSLKKARKKRK